MRISVILAAAVAGSISSSAMAEGRVTDTEFLRASRCKGLAEGLSSDSAAIDAFLKTDQGKQCCELKGTVPDDTTVLGLGVGAGVRKEDTALKEKINVAIAELAKQKKFTEITKNYPELQGILVTPENK